MRAARNIGQHGHRDATLILVAYLPRLRVSDLVSLRWAQVDLAQELLHVVNLKNGVDSTHPIRGPELRALRCLQRDNGPSPFVAPTDILTAPTACTHYPIPLEGTVAGHAVPADSTASPSIHA